MSLKKNFIINIAFLLFGGISHAQITKGNWMVGGMPASLR